MDMTGLGENAVDECMAELVKYRVVLRISESVANMGVEWSMQTDDALIDLQGLQARDAKRRETNSAKIAKAQEKRKGRYVEHTPHVERPPRGYVQHTPQKTIKTNLVVVVNSGDVAKIYEQEFGAITSMIADTIQDACETYPIDWIPEAMVIAVKNNKRNWKYVEGILKNCKEKNVRPALNKFEPKERIYGNNYAGNRQRAKQPKPANADPAAEYSQADIDTAAEINASVR
jgi:DnaD/phage-associated family protein